MSKEDLNAEESSEEVAEDSQQETLDEYDIDEPQDSEFDSPVIDDLDDGSGEHESEDSAKEVDSEETQDDESGESDKEDAQEKSTVSDSLKAQAKELGLSDVQIDAFGSEEGLRTAVEIAKGVSSKSDSGKEKDTQANLSDGEFKVELDPDIYDPEICKAVNETANQINGIKTLLNDVVGSIQEQSQQSFEREFDSLISSNSDDFGEVLGTGSIDQIERTSEHFTNRCKVIDEMSAIASGYAQTGKELPSQKDLFTRAVRGLFSVDLKDQARKEIADKLQKRSNQFISRPGSRKVTKSSNPVTRAEHVVGGMLSDIEAYGEKTESETDF